MYFYLSSAWENRDMVREAARFLQDKGHVWTFDWTVCGTPNDVYPRIIAEEIEAVRRADVFIALLPGGKGTHVELGAALASGKPVYLWAAKWDEIVPTLAYVHPLVRRGVSTSLKAFLSKVVSEWESGEATGYGNVQEACLSANG